MKGKTSIKVGKERIKLHFGLFVIERLERVFNAQLTELYDTGEKDENDKPIIGSKFLEAISVNQIKFAANLLFWGHWFVLELEGEEPEITINDAYLWLDEVGVKSDEMAKVYECFNESLKSHLPEVEKEDTPELKKK